MDADWWLCFRRFFDGQVDRRLKICGKGLTSAWETAIISSAIRK